MFQIQEAVEVFLFSWYIVLEYDSTNTLILPETETLGTSSDCSSIYCVRWNTEEGTTLLTSGMGNDFAWDVQVIAQEEGETYGTVFVEVDIGLAMKRTDSAARLRGLR